MASAVWEMVTGSRIGWPESSNSLWDRAFNVILSALPKPTRTSSDVDMDSENAWLEQVCRGRFESRDRDEVTGNAGVVVVECVTFETLPAGKRDATTAGTAGLSDAFSLPLAVGFDPPTGMLDVVISSRLDPDCVPSAKGSNLCVFFSVSVT